MKYRVFIEKQKNDQNNFTPITIVIEFCISCAPHPRKKRRSKKMLKNMTDFEDIVL